MLKVKNVLLRQTRDIGAKEKEEAALRDKEERLRSDLVDVQKAARAARKRVTSAEDAAKKGARARCKRPVSLSCQSVRRARDRIRVKDWRDRLADEVASAAYGLAGDVAQAS